ncbi:MAG: GbsR/MarR family transcriptional regulator [Anaerolineae bacterium]
MTDRNIHIKQGFVEALSQISRFWGFPKGVGAVFGVLYLAPTPISLDDIAVQTGLTKGAVSTNVRSLARMGLVHRSSRLGDRKDYYVAETDFYRAIRAILNERQNSEFALAIESVRTTLTQLKSARGAMDEQERAFLLERVQALQDFFDAIDSLTRAVVKLDKLGIHNVQKILSVLK